MIAPSSLSKKWGWLRAGHTFSHFSRDREVPVPRFKHAANPAQRIRVLLLVSFIICCSLHIAQAQWRNRYPKLQGYGLQIYPEGYDLPVLNAGPGDPAVSPGGKRVAVAARGWIWVVDLDSRNARRVTHTAGMDSRPAWSPGGNRIAFVRDDGSDTTIVEIELETGAEQVLVDTPAIDLDPTYGRSGEALYYSSAQSGALDIWRLELATGKKERLTAQRGLELCPRPLPGERQVVFVSKSGWIDSVSLLDLGDGSVRQLATDAITSQTRPAVRPDGRSIALNLPASQSWKLWLMDLEEKPAIQVARGARLPLMPAWSPDGEMLYYVEADGRQRFQLLRVRAAGGESEDVSPTTWDWQEPTGRLVIKTRRSGAAEPLPVRLNVLDGGGHPAVPESGQPRFDLQNGIVYFYSPGVIELEVPAGEVQVTAAHGLAAPVAKATLAVEANQTVVAELELAPVWDAAAHGWYSGDHHFHLNYGGPYELEPEVLVEMLQAEDVDVATPLLANLHTRVEDLQWWGWSRLASGAPLVAFGHEVRAHFLGHVGIINVASPFWPSFWGPGYPVYGRDDRRNADVLAHAHAQGGIGYYVHPVVTRDPFPPDGPPRGVPLEFVPDALLGEVDALEIACLWSDELGTSQAWYRLLGVGVPLAPSAGTDAFPNFYRTMALGTARVYVQVDGVLNFDKYVAGLRAGRSFVSTGPLLRFSAGGAGPGDVVKDSAGEEIEWSITLASAVPVKHVELIVNGEVAWSGDGLDNPGERNYAGRLTIPAGGWVAARAHGGTCDWPVMNSYPFAHTAPVWFTKRGSRDPAASRAAAADLLRWMDVAQQRLQRGYGDAPIPKLRERFSAARRKLEELTQQ